MAFTEIKTQEEFDKAIKERLDRQIKTTTEEVEKKYSGWISPEALTAKTKELNDQISKLTEKRDELAKENETSKEKIKAYETDSVKTRVALSMGIPYELKDRLSGGTEEEIKADAQTLSKFIGKSKNTDTAPLAESEGSSGINSDYLALAGNLI